MTWEEWLKANWSKFPKVTFVDLDKAKLRETAKKMRWVPPLEQEDFISADGLLIEYALDDRPDEVKPDVVTG